MRAATVLVGLMLSLVVVQATSALPTVPTSGSMPAFPPDPDTTGTFDVRNGTVGAHAGPAWSDATAGQAARAVTRPVQGSHPTEPDPIQDVPDVHDLLRSLPPAIRPPTPNEFVAYEVSIDKGDPPAPPPELREPIPAKGTDPFSASQAVEQPAPLLHEPSRPEASQAMPQPQRDPAPSSSTRPTPHATAHAGEGPAWPAVVTGLVPVASGLVLLGLLLRAIRHHPVRGAIIGVVAAEPGIHFNEIVRRLELGNHQAALHLRRLERQRLLRRVRHQGYTCFFLHGEDPQAGHRAMALKAPTARRLLEHLQSRPSQTVREAAAALGVTQRVLHHHIPRLVAAGLIEVDRGVRPQRMRTVVAGEAGQGTPWMSTRGRVEA